MKRVKIAVTLIVLIIIYSVTSLFILDNQNDLLKGRIEKIQQVYESGDVEGALALSNELNDFWHSYERKVTMIIHDDALANLNISIAKVTPFISNENDELIAITKELADTLRKNRTVDWQKKESARAKMRMLIKKLLKKHKYPPEGMDDAVQTVMTQCELWTDNVMEV